MVLFFFFKQKTAYEMRISDWSSDVCSSDLMAGVVIGLKREEDGAAHARTPALAARASSAAHSSSMTAADRSPSPISASGQSAAAARGVHLAIHQPISAALPASSAQAALICASTPLRVYAAHSFWNWEIGRGSCRERVCRYG